MNDEFDTLRIELRTTARATALVMALATAFLIIRGDGKALLAMLCVFLLTVPALLAPTFRKWVMEGYMDYPGTYKEKLRRMRMEYDANTMDWVGIIIGVIVGVATSAVLTVELPIFLCGAFIAILTGLYGWVNLTRFLICLRRQWKIFGGSSPMAVESDYNTARWWAYPYRPY